MRLFIISIFLTFVVLQNINAAPQSTPIKSSPIENKKILNEDSEDFFPPHTEQDVKLEFGGIGGAFGDSDAKDWHYRIGIFKKNEFLFERYLVWGVALMSNQSAELRLQSDLTSLFRLDPIWQSFGIGFSQFVWGQDGLSNLVNINQSKFTGYVDLGPHAQLQMYYGLKGLAYALSFQSWF
ncbi:MAG: hypothetical protein JNL11_15315 [Bdellovibrionaceae bacterium]|nr:hypothetical protein [Pseudobdellovibrionaceae bacterium]